MRNTDGPGVKELIPGLTAGCIWDLRALLALKPHTLAVLDALPPWVWEEGFSGGVLYYPTEKYGVLPVPVLERLTEEIVSLVKDGKRVALFSREDCGRIGFVAACALFQLGVREPIPFLKKVYGPAMALSAAQEREALAYCARHMARTFGHCVQMARHVQIRDVAAFQTDPDVQRAYRQAAEALGENARFLVRFSGLLPSARLTVEAPTEELCEACLDSMIDVLKEKGHFIGLLDDDF